MAATAGDVLASYRRARSAARCAQRIILTAAVPSTEFTADEPTVISSAYQQILAVLGTATTGMRAKDICLALDIQPLPKHIEGTRAKLKRLVSHRILTEAELGVFTLAPEQT